jgi:nickel-dependent lactate racemase
MVSTEKSVIWLKAGDIETIEKEMVQAVDQWAMYELERTRYVVISPGPPPSSLTIYGTQNCLDMALKGAIKDRGEVLILAPCTGHPEMPDGVRGISPSEVMKELFWDNLIRLKDLPYDEALKWIQDNFVLGLWKTNRILDLLNVKGLKLYLHCDLPDERISPGGFIPVKDPQAWIDERIAREDGLFNIIDRGNKILTLGV